MDWIEQVKAWLHPSANNRTMGYLASEMGGATMYLGRLLNGRATPSLAYLDRLSAAMTAKGLHTEPVCTGCPLHPVVLTLSDGSHITREGKA